MITYQDDIMLSLRAARFSVLSYREMIQAMLTEREKLVAAGVPPNANSLLWDMAAAVHTRQETELARLIQQFQASCYQLTPSADVNPRHYTPIPGSNLTNSSEFPFIVAAYVGDIPCLHLLCKFYQQQLGRDNAENNHQPPLLTCLRSAMKAAVSRQEDDREEMIGCLLKTASDHAISAEILCADILLDVAALNHSRALATLLSDARLAECYTAQQAAAAQKARDIEQSRLTTNPASFVLSWPTCSPRVLRRPQFVNEEPLEVSFHHAFVPK